LFTNQLKEYGLTFIVDVIEFGGGGLWKLTQTELGDSTLQKKIRRGQENLLGDEPFYIQTLIP
jgi:hypothetical protein